MNTEPARPRVFLSYAYEDRPVAERLANSMRERGLNTWFDQWEVSSTDSIADRIRDAIQASDVLVVLITDASARSSWVTREIEEARSPHLRPRRLAIVPVVVGDAQIPNELSALRSVRLTDAGDPVDSTVVAEVERLLAVDLSSLDPLRFESLVADLLPRLGFTSIRSESALAGLRFDFEATFVLPDPFGDVREQLWLIEARHHRTQRISPNVIAELAGRLFVLPSNYVAAVITSGTLTSAAREYVDRLRRERSLELRLIEGDDLRQLIARYGDLVDRYFRGDDAG